jgi:hypothetical protein
MSINWSEITQQVLNYVLPIVIAFVVAKVLPKLSPTTQAGIDWLKGQASHVKNQAAAGILNRVISLVGQKVLAFEQTFIEDMKTKVASGRIDPKDIPGILKEEKDKLLAQLKSELTLQGIWDDAKALLGGEDGLVMKWLDQVLEAQVAQLPPSGLQTQASSGQPAAVALAPVPVAPVVPAAPAVPPPAAA